MYNPVPFKPPKEASLFWWVELQGGYNRSMRKLCCLQKKVIKWPKREDPGQQEKGKIGKRCTGEASKRGSGREPAAAMRLSYGDLEGKSSPLKGCLWSCSVWCAKCVTSLNSIKSYHGPITGRTGWDQTQDWEQWLPQRLSKPVYASSLPFD